jgi:hypothetical protein
MRIIQFTLFIILTLMVACTPKIEENITNSDGFVEKDIDPTKTSKIAEFDKRDELDLNKRLAKSIIEKHFKTVSNINDVEIKQYKHAAPYYLVAKGKKNDEAVLIAMELLRKGGELHASEYNTLHTMCTAKSCESCTFRIDKNGEIGDCNCAEATIESKNSPCEHRIFIKTLEKEF